MKKKELLKKVSNVCKSSESDIVEVDHLGKMFFRRIFKTSLIHCLIYILFILLSVSMYHKISHLSFISEDFYLILVAVLLGVTTLISIGFYTLYIYNKEKNNQVSLKQVKYTYRFYQIFDIISFIGLFLTMFLWILIFIVTPVEVSGTSMENTFFEEDKLLVWHIGYEPSKNDVVIVDSQENYPKLTGVDFIVKRVIATSGDTVMFISGDIYVNGDLTYKNATVNEFRQMLTIDNTGEVFFDGDIGVVPEGYSIVLGDNRINSYDSKSIGLIHNEDIVGKCILRIFPLDKFGIIG